MNTIHSKLNVRDAQFAANAQAMRAQVADLKAQIERVAAGGGEVARKRHTSRGKLLPRERVQSLLDPGTPYQAVWSVDRLSATDLNISTKLNVNDVLVSVEYHAVRQ